MGVPGMERSSATPYNEEQWQLLSTIRLFMIFFLDFSPFLAISVEFVHRGEGNFSSGLGAIGSMDMQQVHQPFPNF